MLTLYGEDGLLLTGIINLRKKSFKILGEWDKGNGGNAKNKVFYEKENKSGAIEGKQTVKQYTI